MKDMIKSTSVFVLISIIASILLSFVYNKTYPEIEKRAKEDLISKLSVVFPIEDVNFEETIPETLWLAKKDNNIIGIIFVNYYKGYSGNIKVIVGVDTDGKVLKVFIPKEALTETPGLGMKVAEEFFVKQFEDLTKDEIYLRKNGGKIDGITAATISSNATVNAVRLGIEKYLPMIKEIVGEKWYLKRIREIFQDTELESIGENSWKVGDRIVYYCEGEGYSGKIGVIVVLKDEKIENIYVQSKEEGFCETEGIGSKIIDENFIKKFIGTKPFDIIMIDGISGATISSNAVKNAIIEGYKILGGEE